MRKATILLLFAAVLPNGAADVKAVLWQMPARTNLADWTWGPGGQAKAPQPPFEFIEEDLNGTNPKIKVRDAKGDHLTVKFGGEDHGEVFAGRILFAVGYAAQASYFVRDGAITTQTTQTGPP